ncbi:ABC transporter substrate-binding protein [Labrys miyagiensis]
MITRAALFGVAILVSLPVASPALADPKPALAMRGEPALAPGFGSFPYVDVDAPKGGTASYPMLGTFDSVNPLIVNGAPSPGTNTLVFESVMARSLDEPFTFYPSIAEAVETPPDRSWVEFTLDPRAKFSDGVSVTADDLKFSAELLREKGRPGARTTYGQIADIIVRDPRHIRFVFSNASNRELPLLMAGMPVLPRHAIDPANFDKSTLKPMIGSGPYVFDRIDPGNTITFRRNPDWWGKDLPANRGLYNFDRIRYVYYRDPVAMFEAFKTGQYDVRPEGEASNWATGYDFAAARDGRVIRQEIANGLPKPAVGWVFNTRRPIFADVRVRQALGMMFDFEWANARLYYGLYRRTCGYFDGSILSSCGTPADEREKALLAPFPGAVSPDVMDGTWRPTVNDGSGRDRKVARQALDLLRQAGWSIHNGKLQKDGVPFTFEITVGDKATERMALVYADGLKLLGIDVNLRMADDAQFQRRKQNYDFDMLQFSWQSSLSPGMEQNFRWSSEVADVPGSFNYAGVKSPAVDAMIRTLLAAESQEDFVAAVRALDRLLISGNYAIPLFHAPRMWIARWNGTTRPDKPAMALGAYSDTLASDPILAHVKAP